MTVRIVRLGSPRHKNEGLRIGTVRRPPRGVAKSDFARQDWYDIWYPNLAPDAATVKMAQQATTPSQWQQFRRKYRTQMRVPENRRTLELLAQLSHQTNFSVGCYCEDEARCHRGELRQLLADAGAHIED